MEQSLRVKELSKIPFFMLFLGVTAFADMSYNVNNTNFTISQEDLVYNYNRLRLESDYTDENFYIKFIGDGVNYLGEQYINSLEFAFRKRLNADTPFQTQTPFYDYKSASAYAKLYRFYGGYEDESNNITFGLQNIAMGVGKFWTPTNIFNPYNTYALEPDETFGVMALSYTRNLTSTSSASVVVSQREDKSLKYALRYKAFVEVADIALDIVSSNDTKMIGYEVQGNLAQTGIEVQSEAAYIETKLKGAADEKEEFYQMTLGADYGFENGVVATVEALYSSQTFSNAVVLANYDSEVIANLVDSNYYGAMGLSCEFSLFLSGSMSYIQSFNKSNLKFFAPTLTYTINDYNSLSVGAMMQESVAKSLYGDRYYLKYSLSF